MKNSCTLASDMVRGILRTLQGLTGPILLACLGLCVTGCKTFKDTSSNSNLLPSVTVNNRTMDEIAATTITVFQNHGFKGGRTGPVQFVFEQAGTRKDQLLYGEWLGNDVSWRAVVSMEAQGNAVRLVCEATIVKDAGDSFFEESRRVKAQKKAFQKLLDEIAKQLK
jgi:hypothetical protein